jgi:hypothetical protein
MSVEHPRRYFKPTICLLPFQRAAKKDITRLVDGPMNTNSSTKLRMMSIKYLAKKGPVGVLNRCCTIERVVTLPSAISAPDGAKSSLTLSNFSGEDQSSHKCVQRAA